MIRLCPLFSNTFPLEQQTPHRSSLIEKVYSVANGSLSDLVASTLLYTFVIEKYAFPHTTLYPLAGILTVTLITAIVKSLWNLWAQNELQAKNDPGIFLIKAKPITQFSLVHLGNLAFPGLYIHEQFGHGLIARILYNKPNVEVLIKPFERGNTSYAVSYGLTKIGQYFGKRYSLILIASAGLAASLTFATVEFTIAHLIKEKYPKVSQLITYHGISQITMEVAYGIFSLINSKNQSLNNDYIRIWRTAGIHPVIPLGILILIPLVQHVALNYFFNRQISKSNPCQQSNT